MNISLCMIVKNEERIISDCLESIKDYVNEIIIVDTGSIDKTKEISSRYTSKIYDFTWCNDFSAARNYSISKAKNDWILVLDADEVLKTWRQYIVNRFIKDNEKSIGRIKIVNITREENGTTNKVNSHVGRLFNKNHYNYSGIIHEQLTRKENIEQTFIDLNIVLEHTGYLKEVLDEKDKLTRNIKLIEKAILDNPRDPYMHYQLGKSQYLQKNYIKSIESFEEALYIGDIDKYEYFEDLVETYGYSLLNSEQYQKSMIILDYKDIYSNSPDYNFLVGLIYMNNGMFKESIESYNKCIQSRNKARGEGVNSYKSYYNIGVIYECLGDRNLATYYYKKCKDYNPAVKRLLMSRI